METFWIISSAVVVSLVGAIRQESQICSKKPRLREQRLGRETRRRSHWRLTASRRPPSPAADDRAPGL